MSLVVERHPGFVVATINAPERLNAISSIIYEALNDLIAKIEQDLEFRCLVLTGAGRAFCAGADLKERGSLDAAGRWRYVRRLNEVIDRLDNTPVPVIASINGLAFGGGVELITASDMRLCLHSALFALPEVKLGIIPGGSIVRLNRMGLERVAVKLAFSGEPMTADEALRLGLVDYVCADEKELRSRTIEAAHRISRNAPLALRAAKKLLRGSMTGFTAPATQLAMEVRAPLEATEDSKEGLAAFATKRPPNFVGR